MKANDGVMYRGVVFAGVLTAMFGSFPLHAQVSDALNQVSDALSSAIRDSLGKSYADMVQSCVEKWEDSDAYDYCSSADVTVPSVGSCQVNGSCSITVAVDDTDTTFTPSISNLTQSTSQTDDIDICFAEDTTATSGYTAAVKAGCATGETDSGDAVSNGLGDSGTTTTTTTTTDGTTECTDKWDDAPAYSYCSSATVTWSATDEECTVSGSCSIKVWVDDEEATFTPSAGNSQSVDDTADLDICFTNNTSTITATVRTGCNTGEVTSGNAYYDQSFPTHLWTSSGS